ncbi:MAG: integration host factor subunit beta [Aestuariivita sp.]|nr:integration host factor subunit beta [Aestuariivita sp.]
MVRSELTREIYFKLSEEMFEENFQFNYADAERIVDIFFEHIIEALEKGNRVELRGFGVFWVKKRRSRVGRNPRTGELVQVTEKHIPFFKAGKNLKKQLNGV